MDVSKLRSRDEVRRIIEEAKARGERVVFTNGCFDLLHPGHVVYLAQARELGDMLVLALNSDASVRSLKGPTRPIMNEQERALTMSGLASVSWIVLFDEKRVVGLLDELRPTVWAKGGDYTLDTLDQDERRMAESHGIEIALIPPVEGISTTGILERIEQAKQRG
ncbi:MAG: adenylyltransferase/cytidyltransferase family protein [Armatimonadetes bacterium]|nr:adenylyltransferase/cytidyltransferase family protein [Armatimonadota bacterium]